MTDNLFANFVSKFLKKLNENNLKCFYNLFFIDKSVGIYNFSEGINYRARIIKIMLENEQSADRKLLIEVLQAIYDTYSSLHIVSEKTLPVEESDEISDMVDGFSSGDLINHEFNLFFAEFFKLFSEHKVMYHINYNILTVKYFDPIYKVFCKSDYRLEEKRENIVNIVSYGISKRLKSVSRIRKLLAKKGWKHAFTIHKEIILALPEHNTECAWCTPTVKTKHKCPNCVQLFNAYNSIVSKNKDIDLPKDLNQVIKRIKKKNALNLNDYRSLVQNKVSQLINNSNKLCKDDRSKLNLLVQQAFEV